MNNKKIVGAFAGMVMLSTAGSALATVLDFTTGNLGVAGSDAYNSVSMSVDGIGVDITAYTIENNGNGVISSQTQITGTDLGVYVSGSDNLGVSSRTSGDSHSLDGGSISTDLDEGLLFSFDQMVSLDFVDFDRFGGNDDFNLTVDGVTLLVDFDENSTSVLAEARATNSTYFDFANVTGYEFLIWADSDSDSFRIDSMNVSAVPAPASLLLISLGLVGLGFSRVKRNKVA